MIFCSVEEAVMLIFKINDNQFLLSGSKKARLIYILFEGK